jgi:hypothetical protein
LDGGLTKHSELAKGKVKREAGYTNVVWTVIANMAIVELDIEAKSMTGRRGKREAI